MTRSDTGPFAIVPRWLLHMEDIKGGDVYVYALLAEHADKAGASHYAHKTMAREMGSSVSSVKRHLKTLVEQGAISVKHRETQSGSPTTNEYTVYRMPPKKARTPQSKNGLGPIQKRTTDPDPMNKTLRGEEETPSARNLSSSGEKTRAWMAFSADLSSASGEGILSPVGSSRAYTRTCVLNPDWPPVDVDLSLLKDVARAVKAGMGLRTVLLPLVKDMRQTAEWFGRLQADRGEDFLPWLEWASAQVERKGSLAKAKLLLQFLTQAGTLKPFSEWEAERTVLAS